MLFQPGLSSSWFQLDWLRWESILAVGASIWLQGLSVAAFTELCRLLWEFLLQVYGGKWSVLTKLPTMVAAETQEDALS